MRRLLSITAKLTLAVGLLVSVLAMPAQAEQKTTFRVGWSIYAGWMPWPYADMHGIIPRWAEKYGIKIEMVQFNDYIEGVNQFTAGSLDVMLVASQDALSIPAAGGVDTTAFLLGDYSNGNDTILMKSGSTPADLKGKRINLVQFSVSHYLLARALESAGLTERDVTVVNTSDADAIAAWGTPDVEAMVTWNPMSATILAGGNATLVYDSSKIPGEIIDMAIGHTQTLKDNPALAKALTGAWFEILAQMQGDSPEAIAARTEMAKMSGTDLAGYDAQLATTFMFYTPKEAAAFATSADVGKYMDLQRQFLFQHNLLGEGASSPDAVGIQLPDGKILGDANNVKLRFDPTYTVMAAEGKL
ncbi:putative urea ABC transporter substrate-binding protein [Zavarzinia sp. CC-PAN008]|uniref:putative urea ABC transporter substrate-binding protein n=1 Tax=Zavarzinia sp. CC-PAN008 TaxID=3243332 RepID=UPI003F744F41